MPPIHYSFTRPREKRKYYVTPEDIKVLLSRLPEHVWQPLRAVHFNDRSRGARRLGYVNMGHREIAICALPPRVSLSRFLIRHSPLEFGAIRGRQWPETAVRRFVLYDVFLHELGHLQVVKPNAKRVLRRFAVETKAQAFADYWRRSLWEKTFDHPDPIHNYPSIHELTCP